jgi:RimJ/RimL family protein N-acetyltransferase
LTYRVIYDEKERVGDFVSSMVGGANWGAHTAIGLERDGELIAGVVYDTYTGPSIAMHVAAIPGRRWMVREFLCAVFRYPFLQLGCDRITGPVASFNADALKFDLHLGFEYEATLAKAVPGGDLILLVMWRDKCRWLDVKGLRK